MLLSMTGFGRVKSSFGKKTIQIEIRSLNSKYTDVRLKIPTNYREKEADLRKILLDKAERGKLEFALDVQSFEGDDDFGLNKSLFHKYYEELTSLAGELGLPQGDLLQTILKMPNVVSGEPEGLDEGEWKAVRSALDQALASFTEYREKEGVALEKDMRERIDRIQHQLGKLKPFEQDRVDKLRSRLYQNLEEYMDKDRVDENRFEQEILFYLEKMDINEEKVRLEQHCKYFLEVLDQKKAQKGRKLSFIAQEMGREINTIGAKAYSSDIQRVVVGMKDELEKIKEQVANTV